MIGNESNASPAQTISNPLASHDTLSVFYKQIPVSPRFLTTVIQCEIKNQQDMVFTGVGESTFTGRAKTKAFAEAFERFIYRCDPAVKKLGLISTNGFAAGNTVADAAIRARNELLERQVILNFWETKTGFLHHSPRSLLARYLLDQLSRLKASVSLFVVSAMDETHKTRIDVLAGTLRVKNHLFFDSGFITEMKQAEIKLLRTLIRMLVVRENVPIPIGWELPHKGAPVDHITYYAHLENHQAFNFLDTSSPPTSIPRLLLKNSEKIEETTLIDLPGYPRVVVAQNKGWESLRWGTQSMQSKQNSWPHPIM